MTPPPSLLASQSSVFFYINLSVSLGKKTQLSHVEPKRLAGSGVSPSLSLSVSISLSPSPRVAILCLLLHQSIDSLPSRSLFLALSSLSLALVRSPFLFDSFFLSLSRVRVLAPFFWEGG